MATGSELPWLLEEKRKVPGEMGLNKRPRTTHRGLVVRSRGRDKAQQAAVRADLVRKLRAKVEAKGRQAR